LELLEPSGSGSSVYGAVSARDPRLSPKMNDLVAEQASPIRLMVLGFFFAAMGALYCFLLATGLIGEIVHRATGRPRRLIPTRLRRLLIITTVILIIAGVTTLIVGAVRLILD
jgi:hypothetical protein